MRRRTKRKFKTSVKVELRKHGDARYVRYKRVLDKVYIHVIFPYIKPPDQFLLSGGGISLQLFEGAEWYDLVVCDTRGKSHEPFLIDNMHDIGTFIYLSACIRE